MKLVSLPEAPVRHLALLALLSTLALAAPAPAQDEGPPPGQDQPAPGEPDRPEGQGQAGDAPAAPAPAPADEQALLKGTPLFPLQAGRRWHYALRFSIKSTSDAPGEEPTDDVRHTLDVYVADPLPVEGRTAAVLEWKLDQELAQRSFYMIEGGEVKCVLNVQGYAEHLKDFPLVPAQTVMKEPLEVGATWTWTGKAGPTPGTQVYRVSRRETIETPAGTFEAVVLEVEYTGEDDSHGRAERWYAPDVGLVREVSEVKNGTAIFRTEGVLTKWE